MRGLGAEREWVAGRGEEGAFVLTATARSKRTSLQWSYVSTECEWMYSSCHMLVVLVLVVLVPLVPNAAPGVRDFLGTSQCKLDYARNLTPNVHANTQSFLRLSLEIVHSDFEFVMLFLVMADLLLK